MSNQNISGKSLKGIITSEDILGKDVFDVNGKLVGVTEKVLIDPKSLTFIGIEVDKGFMHKGFVIGKGYINAVAEDAIFLNINIFLELKGTLVFDRDGEELGKVAKVNLQGNQNSIESIEVNTGMLKKNILVSQKLIRTLGENVILNVTKKDINQLPINGE